MLDVLYEDKDVLVVVKPAGIESQTSRRLEPDMVSEIKNYLHRKAQEAKKLSTGLSPKASTVTVEPYVGVIHRLDKPVRGVMVYAKNQRNDELYKCLMYILFLLSHDSLGKKNL